MDPRVTTRTRLRPPSEEETTMTKREAGRLGGKAARKRHRWTSEAARAAGRKGGKASSEARRCRECGRVPARGRAHVCASEGVTS